MDCPVRAWQRTAADHGQVLLEAQVKEALIRLNPEIAEEPKRADEVLHRLRAIILSARHWRTVAANEEFAAWLNGDRSMPFGPGGAHTTVRLIDFDNPEPSANQWMVSTEVTFTRVGSSAGSTWWCGATASRLWSARRSRRCVRRTRGSTLPRRFTRTTRRTSRSSSCRTCCPSRPRARTSATARSGCRSDMWGPWREEAEDDAPVPVGLAAVKEAVQGVLTPGRSWTSCGSSPCSPRTRSTARSRSSPASSSSRRTNLIVERVLRGRIKKGLIWHFQGSGKSLLMVFTAQKLRAMAGLTNPTVLIVVDRIDLDTQITGTFTAADVPNLVSTDSRAELQTLLRDGSAEGHHHDDPQVRRGAGRARRPGQHHRDGRRGAPIPGGRLRAQDARGAAQRVPVRAHRHPDQQAGPKHLLCVRLRGGRGRLPVPVHLPATPSATARRCRCTSSRGCPRFTSTKTRIDEAFDELAAEHGLSDADKKTLCREARRVAGDADQVPRPGQEGRRRHRRALHREGRTRTASRPRSSSTTRPRASPTRRRSTSTSGRTRQRSS